MDLCWGKNRLLMGVYLGCWKDIKLIIVGYM